MLGGGEISYFRVGAQAYLWTWDAALVEDGGLACASRLEAYEQARKAAAGGGLSVELRSRDETGDRLIRVLAPESRRSRAGALAG